MQLRPYQFDVSERVFEAWESVRNVMLVLPTGAGKTVVKTHIAKVLNQRTMCIAHRQELVLQISCALASFGIYHRVIAPLVVVKFCAERHVKLFGRSYVDHQATFAVAGVRTLINRADQYRSLVTSIQLWDIDEAHHVLPENQWGTATRLFPNARGLGVTATPLRCDRKALSDTFNHMVVGPTMRDLINDGHLSDYRIFCPPQSVRREDLRVSQSTGDFIQREMINAVHGSQIVGDIVQQYCKIARGKRGLTFCVDVQSATETAEAYRAAGVPAQLVTGTTPDRERADYLDKLASGELHQLVNVDLFGEGMDSPALEVVSMGRPTQSYGLYTQQFGRALRTFKGKKEAIIIDHVGNVIAHGLPDRPRDWSLEGGAVRAVSEADDIPMRACIGCMQPYERFRTICPYCGTVPVPAGRALPEQVDGDLEELDEATLAEMRGNVIALDSEPLIPYGATGPIIGAKKRDHRELLEQQAELRECITYLAGAWKHGDGQSDREINKRFYLVFNITIPEALALRRADAEKLTNRIRNILT